MPLGKLLPPPIIAMIIINNNLQYIYRHADSNARDIAFRQTGQRGRRPPTEDIYGIISLYQV